MIRPFTLRDLPLVRRLSEQGVSLHPESALVDNLNPLRGALLSMVTAGHSPTLVWKSQDRNKVGFIQVLLEDDRHHAHILYVSPMIEPRGLDSPDGHNVNRNSAGHIWLPLLEQAVVEVAQHGVHSLVAEVSEDGPELPILRRAGFVVYTRQDIWVLEPAAMKKQAGDDGVGKVFLRPRETSDDWDIQLLYASTVPHLVQLVEPSPPLNGDNTWVLREKGDLAAYVHVHEGTTGTWLRFFIHPNAEANVDQIVTAALRTMKRREHRPVYCCVRRYDGWLTNALERNGFQTWGSQAVMVKYTVHHARKVMPKASAVLEKQGMPVSSPYIQHFRSHENGDQDDKPEINGI